jgi:WD repeat-containing protein 23
MEGTESEDERAVAEAETEALMTTMYPNYDTDNDDEEDEDYFPPEEEEEEEDEDDYVDFSVSGDEENIDTVNLQLSEEELSNELRFSISNIFNGEPFYPMMFVRTDKERLQQKMLPHERIAYELHTRLQYLKNKQKDEKKMFHVLRLREQVGQLKSSQMLQLQETFMPFQKNKHCKVVDYVRDRLYCGGFNSSGDRFLIAGQTNKIILYDTIDWTRKGALPCRDVRWTVTDAKFMPDDTSVLYSSINSNVRMVSVDYENNKKEEVFSLVSRNTTNASQQDIYSMYMSRFGVWCVDMNANGTEFVAGTSNNQVILYDITTRTPLSQVEGHDEDVNAIAFVDGPIHSNVFVSGSDDSLIKLWDRRTLSDSNPTPQGVFLGHTDGLTHISSRDDGYYFLSNSKDQSCKLWDIRKCFSAGDHAKLPHFHKPYNWDYRYEMYPGRHRLPVGHPNDISVMTYRGHVICETLIRCYFSPLHTTAQKYVYTGSADGRVYVYDVVTGNLVEIFAMKPNGLTRDVRWHPFEPMIVSPDFYGKLCVWQRQQ